MPLTRPQAEWIARTINALRPDYPTAAIAHALTQPDTIGYTPLQLIAATALAADPTTSPGTKTIKGGLPKALNHITQIINHQWDTQTPMNPQNPMNHKPEPAYHRAAPECPVPGHTGGYMGNCAMCASEMKTGMRPVNGANDPAVVVEEPGFYFTESTSRGTD